MSTSSPIICLFSQKHDSKQFPSPFNQIHSTDTISAQSKSHGVLLSQRSDGRLMLYVQGQLYHPGLKFPDCIESFADWTPLEGFTDTNVGTITHVSCCQNETVLVRRNTLEFWSSLNPIWRQTPDWVVKVRLREGIEQVASGRSHHLFLTNEGTVYACGSNATCSLGIKSTNGPIGYPTKVELDFKVTQIACGEEHSCLLSDSGRVYVCGMNTTGSLGLPQLKQSATFQLCSPLLRFKIKKVACGAYFTLALTEEGTLIGMGSSEHSQLLVRDPHCDAPRLLKMLVNYKIVDFACSDRYVVALTSEGRIIGWGDEVFGRELNSCSSPRELNLDLPGRVLRIVGCSNYTWFVCENAIDASVHHSVESTAPVHHKSHPTTQDPIQLMKALNVKLQVDISKLVRMQMSFKSLLQCIQQSGTSTNLFRDSLDDCSKSLHDKKRVTDIKAQALNLLTLLEQWQIDPAHFTHTKIIIQSLCTNIGEWCKNLSQWAECMQQVLRSSTRHGDADRTISDSLQKMLKRAQRYASLHDETATLLNVITTHTTTLVQQQSNASSSPSPPQQSENRNPPTLAVISRNASPKTLPVGGTARTHQYQSSPLTTKPQYAPVQPAHPTQYTHDNDSLDFTETFDENLSEHGSMMSSTMFDDITQSFLEQDQIRAFEKSLHISLSERIMAFNSAINERLTRFTQQLARAKRTIHLTKQSLSEQNEELIQHKIHLNHLQAENERLRADNRQKSQACTQLEVDYVELRKQNIQEKQILEEKLNRLTNHHSQADEEITSLQYQFAALKEKCESLEQDKITLQEKVKTLQGEKDQLSERYFMLQASAESNNKDRDTEINQLTEELREMREICNNQTLQHKSELSQLYTYLSGHLLGRNEHDSNTHTNITVDDIRLLCDEAMGPAKNQEIAALEQRFYQSEIERKEAESKIKYLEAEIKHKDDTHDLLEESQGRAEVYEQELKMMLEQHVSLVKVRKDLEQELSRVHASLIEEQQQNSKLSTTTKELKTELEFAKETMSDMQKQFEEEIYNLRAMHHNEQQTSEAQQRHETTTRDQQLQLLETQLASYQASEQELEGKLEVYRSELNRVFERERTTSQVLWELDAHCRTLINHLKVYDSYISTLLRQVQTALHISSPSKANHHSSSTGETPGYIVEEELTFSQIHSSPLKHEYTVQRVELSEDMDRLLVEAKRKLNALESLTRPAKSSYRSLERLMQCVQELLAILPDSEFDLQQAAQSLEASVELMNSLHG